MRLAEACERAVERGSHVIVTEVRIEEVDLADFDYLLDDVTELETHHHHDKEVYDDCLGRKTDSGDSTAGTAAAVVP